MKRRHQCTTANNVVFIPSVLPEQKFPTCEEVVNYHLHLKKNDPELTDLAVLRLIADKLQSMWKRTSIPIINTKSLINKIKVTIGKYKQLLENKRKCKSSSASIQRIKSFKNDAVKLFDLARCRCIYSAPCKCDQDSKVPQVVEDFLRDQRNDRRITLMQVTRRLRSQQSENIFENPINDSSVFTQASSSSAATGVAFSQSFNQSDQMRLKLRNIVIAMGRTNVSLKATAIIGNALLQDLGLINVNNTEMVITKSKIQREQKAWHEFLLKKKPNDEAVKSIYFDGRKDETRILEEKGNKRYPREIREEHITMLKEPGGVYLGHTTTESGSALSIKTAMCNFLKTSNIDTSKLVAVGCDGCPVNTGLKNGVIRLLEEDLGRALQWHICQIHGNELILRNLFEHYDGRKTGPSSFAGPLSKKIVDCEKLPLVEYLPVSTGVDLLEDINTDLSTDQKYLLQICNAVASGQCSEELANKKPGRVHHARWLTTACRILRLYVSTFNPNEKLKNLVEVIMKVYTPVWFAIRRNPHCYMGAKHVFLTIKLSRCLKKEVTDVIDRVISKNAFFAHCENILLAMMTDEDIELRIRALRMITNCRSEPKTDVRVFRVPEVNFQASEYTELITWNNVTEPPIVKCIPDDQLEDLVMTNFHSLKEVLNFPCHTQAVERHIKLVTEASKTITGSEARDAKIKTVLLSRFAMPDFQRKSNWSIPD